VTVVDTSPPLQYEDRNPDRDISSELTPDQQQELFVGSRQLPEGIKRDTYTKSLEMLTDMLANAIRYGKGEAIAMQSYLSQGASTYANPFEIPQEDIIPYANAWLDTNAGWSYDQLIDVLSMGDGQKGVDWAWSLTGEPTNQWDLAHLMGAFNPWTKGFDLLQAGWEVSGAAGSALLGAAGVGGQDPGSYLGKAKEYAWDASDRRLEGYGANPYGDQMNRVLGIHNWQDAVWFGFDLVDIASIGAAGAIVQPARNMLGQMLRNQGRFQAANRVIYGRRAVAPPLRTRPPGQHIGPRPGQEAAATEARDLRTRFGHSGIQFQQTVEADFRAAHPDIARPSRAEMQRWYDEGGTLTGPPGTPTTYYHGTAADFEDFGYGGDLLRPGTWAPGRSTANADSGLGFHFSTSSESAEFIGPNIMERRLRLENPLEVDEIFGAQDLRIRAYISELGLDDLYEESHRAWRAKEGLPPISDATDPASRLLADTYERTFLSNWRQEVVRAKNRRVMLRDHPTLAHNAAQYSDESMVPNLDSLTDEQHKLYSELSGGEVAGNIYGVGTRGDEITREWIKSFGYDGLHIREAFMGPDHLQYREGLPEQASWVVFDPDQISKLGGPPGTPDFPAQDLVRALDDYQGMFSSPDDGTRLFEEFKAHPDRYGVSGIDEKDPIVYATERGTFTARELSDDELAEALHSDRAAAELRENKGYDQPPIDEQSDDLHNEIWRRFALEDTPTASLGGPSESELLGMPEGSSGFDAYGTVRGSDFTSKTNPEFWVSDKGTEIYEGRLGSAGLMDDPAEESVAAREWWLALDQETKEAYHTIYRDVRGIANSKAGRTLEDYEVMEMHKWHNPDTELAGTPTLDVPSSEIDVVNLEAIAEMRGVEVGDVTDAHIQDAQDMGWISSEEAAVIREDLLSIQQGPPGTPPPHVPDEARFDLPEDDELLAIIQENLHLPTNEQVLDAGLRWWDEMNMSGRWRAMGRYLYRTYQRIRDAGSQFTGRSDEELKILVTSYLEDNPGFYNENMVPTQEEAQILDDYFRASIEDARFQEENLAQPDFPRHPKTGEVDVAGLEAPTVFEGDELLEGLSITRHPETGEMDAFGYRPILETPHPTQSVQDRLDRSREAFPDEWRQMTPDEVNDWIRAHPGEEEYPKHIRRQPSDPSPPGGTAGAAFKPPHMAFRIVDPDDSAEVWAHPLGLTKIISGGQTGADVAGLRAGRDLGLETGGTAPRGYRTADPAKFNEELRDVYGLTEHASREWPPRTKQNVLGSDGTILFNFSESLGRGPSAGSNLTARYAEELNKPILVIKSLDEIDPVMIRAWIINNDIKVLNVAGNRQGSLDTPLRGRGDPSQFPLTARYMTGPGTMDINDVVHRILTEVGGPPPASLGFGAGLPSGRPPAGAAQGALFDAPTELVPKKTMPLVKGPPGRRQALDEQAALAAIRSGEQTTMTRQFGLDNLEVGDVVAFTSGSRSDPSKILVRVTGKDQVPIPRDRPTQVRSAMDKPTSITFELIDDPDLGVRKAPAADAPTADVDQAIQDLTKCKLTGITKVHRNNNRFTLDSLLF